MRGSFVGYGPIVRLGLRRDRVRLAAWAFGLSIFPVASYTSYESLFPSEASRRALVANFGLTPAFRLLLGPARELAQPGGFTAWRSGLFSGVFVAVMAIFTVVRHTRAEEDAGRADLLAAGVVGRRAMLASGWTLAVGTAAVAGVGAAGFLLAVGAPVAGSVAMGAAVLATGAVFASIAAVAAQLGSFAHTANGLASAVLGVAYVVRGWGDSTDGVSWVSWWSPLGWGQQLHAFTGERWWVLAVPIGFAVVALVVADRVLAHRDLGSGVIVARPGPPTARASLRSPFGLAWRLQRGALVGWIVAYAISGALFGSIASSAGALLADNPTVAKVLSAQSGGPTSAFVAAMVSILGIVAAVYGVQAVARARREETEDRVAPLLATSAVRWRWLGSHLAFGLVGSAVVVVVGGVGVALTSSGAAGAPTFVATVGASLAQVPAIWVLVGVAALLVGVVPRLVGWSWSAVVMALVLTFFGPLLNLPDRVLELSPFTHLAKVPAESLSASSVIVLSALAALLVGLGLGGVSRRDIG